MLERIKSKLLKADFYSHLKNIGVSYGTNCDFSEAINWGSEPYLISIGNHVRIASNVTFITHDGGVWTIRSKADYKDVDLFGKIKIGNNVHVGMGVTIMPGVSIGSNCVIGCNAVVTKSIPDNSIAVGVPARVIESIDEYFEKNKDFYVYTKHMGADEKKNFLLNNNVFIKK